MKYRGASHQDLRPSADHFGNVLGPNAPVHLDAKAMIIPCPYLFEVPNLVQRAGKEFLPAEARVHRHHQHVVHFVQHRSEEHTSELQSLAYLVCRLLLEKKKELRRSLRRLPEQPCAEGTPRTSSQQYL